MGLSQDAKAVSKKYSLLIDLKKSTSNTDFEVVEGDTENYITITLVDDGEPVDLTGCRVIAAFSHSGGSAVQDSNDIRGNIVIDGNVITIHLLTDSFRRGTVECELRIYGSTLTRISTTPTFNFSCRPSLVTDKTVTADMHHSVLTGLLTQVSDVIAAADQTVHDAEQLPRVYVAYSEQNPDSVLNPTLTNTQSQYMGIYYSSAGRAPSSASDYTWVNTQGAPTISSAQVSQNGEMTITLSNNETVDVENMSSCLENLISQRPVATNVSVGEDGKLTINLSDATELQTETLSSYVNSVVTSKCSEYQPNNIYVKDTEVLDSQFEPASDFLDFPYKAEIPVEGITPNHTGTVIFRPRDAISGNFAPIAIAGNGSVAIYAQEIPVGRIWIPLIKGELINNG